jgi:hypothetical protein
MTDMQKTERLARERGRVAESDNPVDKAKSYVVISSILLDFAAGAARDQYMEELKALLIQYTAAIQEGRDTLINSDRNPVRNPDGYREFEIALRGHIRILGDMSQALAIDDREPVQSAITAATGAREEILRRLFPSLPNGTRIMPEIRADRDHALPAVTADTRSAVSA